MGTQPPQADQRGRDRAVGELYYDTAIAGTANSLLPVLATTTPDHVLIGTRLPPSRPRRHRRPPGSPRKPTAMTDEQLAAVTDNTLKLFPAPAHPTQRRMTASSPIRKRTLFVKPWRRFRSDAVRLLPLVSLERRAPGARPRLTLAKQAT